MARNRPVSPLGDILPKVLKDFQTDARPSLDEIQEVWKRLVGQVAAQHSWPHRLVGGRLLVEVANSGWMYTLNLKKAWILQGLVELLGAGRMKGLSFRIGEKKDV